MPVAPVIAKKLKAGDSAKAIGMELDRRAHTYVNDVDLSKSSENVNIATRPGDASPLPLDEAIDRRLGELHVKRKIRKDAVRAVGFIVSSNAALPDDEAKEFLSAAVDWFGDRYGRENLLAASIHMDEGTPHAHLWVCPVVHDEATGYDRLSAKTLFTPDRRVKQADGTWKVTGEGTMTKLQTDFWRDVASRWGFERPLTREQREKGYRSLEAYKTAQGETRELKADKADLEREAEQVAAEVHRLWTRREELRDEVEGLEADVSGLERDVSGLEEQRSALQGWVRALYDLWQAVLEALRFIADAWDGRGTALGENKLHKAVENPILAEPLKRYDAAFHRENQKYGKKRNPDKMTRIFQRAQKAAVKPTREAIGELDRMAARPPAGIAPPEPGQGGAQQPRRGRAR